MKDRKILNASEGMILTDGEVYGTVIFLAEGMSADKYYEIPFEDYESMMADKYPEEGETL